MRQKLHRGRRSVFRKRNPVPRIIGTVVLAVAVVAGGFFGAKWISEHPVTEPMGSEEPTVSAPAPDTDVSAPADAPADTTPDAPATADTVRGFYLPLSKISDTALLSKAKEAGFTAVIFDLKDTEGRLYYRSSNATAVQVNSFTADAMTAEQLSTLFDTIREAGLVPIPRLYAFRDHLGAKALANARISHKDNSGWVWYDGDPQGGGKAWLNPYADAAHEYIIALATELKAAGAGGVMLDGVQFPKQTSAASFGNGAHIALKEEEVLSLFVDKARTALGDCPLLLACTAESALGTATQVYGGNPLTFGATMASPTILPGSLPAKIKVGENTIVNDQNNLQQTVQNLVNQMVLRTKVLAENKQPAITPFLQVAGYSATQVQQEIAGCLAGGATDYILYHPDGQYDFGAY